MLINGSELCISFSPVQNEVLKHIQCKPPSSATYLGFCQLWLICSLDEGGRGSTWKFYLWLGKLELLGILHLQSLLFVLGRKGVAGHLGEKY